MIQTTKLARKQTGKQHLWMPQNNVQSDETNKLRKTHFTESLTKTSGEAFLSAVQMWKCQCNEFLVTVLMVPCGS